MTLDLGPSVSGMVPRCDKKKWCENWAGHPGICEKPRPYPPAKGWWGPPEGCECRCECCCECDQEWYPNLDYKKQYKKYKKELKEYEN